MSKDSQEQPCGPSEIGLGLDELIHRGARQVIQQAIEAELAELLQHNEDVRTQTESVPRRPKFAWTAAAARQGQTS